MSDIQACQSCHTTKPKDETGMGAENEKFLKDMKAENSKNLKFQMAMQKASTAHSAQSKAIGTAAQAAKESFQAIK